MADVRAVVTIGPPSPHQHRFRSTPLLVLHAPEDPSSPCGMPPVSSPPPGTPNFIALDGVGDGVTDELGARRVAGLIAAWAEPYMPDLTASTPVDPLGTVVVTDAGTGRYAQRIIAGRHLLTADEPACLGGTDTGPNPYELLRAALGACTSMTLRMYADRQGLPLRHTTVRLRHDRVHARDCTDVEQRTGMMSRTRHEIDMDGPLTDQDRRRLIEIADRCPVHRTLSSEITFETTHFE